MSLMIPAWVNGVLTPVEKLEAHEKGLKHKAISVFMICNGKILIQRRALEKYHTPGLWANTCCTHPLWNEAPEDCAMRRMKEELAIENIQLIYRDRIEYRAAPNHRASGGVTTWATGLRVASPPQTKTMMGTNVTTGLQVA